MTLYLKGMLALVLFPFIVCGSIVAIVCLGLAELVRNVVSDYREQRRYSDRSRRG